MLKRPKNSTGFTLIELLVVITIIAILATVGLAAYSSLMKNSRNSKRQSDLKFIQSALEEYYADQLYYPVSLGTTLTYTNLTTSLTKTYMAAVPKDPKGSVYSYAQSGCGPGGTGYCLRANLETPAPVSSDPDCAAIASYNYCVTKP